MEAASGEWVSRYLALTTAAYITFKFLHFRVFP